MILRTVLLSAAMLRMQQPDKPIQPFNIYGAPMGNLHVGTQKGFVDVGSQTGRIVKLSDDEYERLQVLRKAVTDAEREIAKAHGVVTEVPTQMTCYTCWPVLDTYEYRGQFLLVNVPESKEAR